MNRLVLIDGNAMMHRAYHALPPLTTPDGTPVNIVYGFVSMILRLYQDLKPTHMAVAFDRPGPTFRNTLYKEYQTQRPKTEDDFISQIPIVHETVTAFGLPAYEADGFEADDVIGTIAEEVRSQKSKVKSEHIDQVIIVTGDRDILQLVVDDRVLVYMPTKGLSEGRLYGEKEVIDRMGVKPSRIPDFKALAGDPSDNYPGVPGIGPKTAANLVNRFRSVEAIYKGIRGDTGTIGETVKTKLMTGKESAILSHELATIRTDAPVSFDKKSARITTLDTPNARKALETLHFPSLLKRLTGKSKEQGVESREHKEKKDTHENTKQQQLF